jgi:hypothetical protein
MLITARILLPSTRAKGEEETRTPRALSSPPPHRAQGSPSCSGQPCRAGVHSCPAFLGAGAPNSAGSADPTATRPEPVEAIRRPPGAALFTDWQSLRLWSWRTNLNALARPSPKEVSPQRLPPRRALPCRGGASYSAGSAAAPHTAPNPDKAIRRLSGARRIRKRAAPRAALLSTQAPSSNYA